MKTPVHKSLSDLRVQLRDNLEGLNNIQEISDYVVELEKQNFELSSNFTFCRELCKIREETIQSLKDAIKKDHDEKPLKKRENYLNSMMITFGIVCGWIIGSIGAVYIFMNFMS